MEAKKNTDKIAILETKINDLRFMFATQQQQESRTIKWFGIIGMGMLIVFVGLQAMTYYSVNTSTDKMEEKVNGFIKEGQKQVDEFLKESRKRVDEYVGHVLPTSTWVDNYYSDGTNIITGRAWIYKISNKEADLADLYGIKIEIPFKIFIEGKNSEKLLGFECQFSEELPNILYSDLDSKAIAELVKQHTAYHYSNLGGEGIMVSPNAGLNLSYIEDLHRLNCKAVEEKLKKLVDAKSVGTITIRPVLEKSSPKIKVKEGRFSLKFISISLQSCKDLM